MRRRFGAAIISLVLLSAAAPASSDWTVTDVTDNDTGLRNVDALNLASSDTEFVIATMKCHDGHPQLYVDWRDQGQGNRVVVSVLASDNPKDEPTPKDFIFEATDDPVDGPLRASDPAGLVAHIGKAALVIWTLHADRDRSIVMKSAGTETAWARVSEWCPPRRGRSNL